MTSNDEATPDRSRLALADPTDATSRALLREITNLEKVTALQIGALEKAVDVAHQDMVRVPTEVQKAVGGLEALIDAKLETIRQMFNVHVEMFNSVQKQFAERDTRTDQAAISIEKAINAALTAQKEQADKTQSANDKAAIKTETAFTKLIDEQGKGMTSVQAAFTTSIDAIKERIGDLQRSLSQITSAAIGRKDTVSESQNSIGVWVAVVAVILSGISGLASIVTLVMTLRP